MCQLPLPGSAPSSACPETGGEIEDGRPRLNVWCRFAAAHPREQGRPLDATAELRGQRPQQYAGQRRQARQMAEANRGKAKGKPKDKGDEKGKPGSEPYGKGGYGRDYYQRRRY